MNKIVKEGKILEEILENIKNENNLLDNEFIFN